MKLTLLLRFFGLLALVSATALKTRRSGHHRLQWLKRVNHQLESRKAHENPDIPTIPIAPTTPYPYYQSSPYWGSATTYNPYYGSSPPYPYGATTSYPWYGSTNWYGGSTSYLWYGSTNWNGGSTSRYGTTWYGSDTTWNPWYTRTTSWYPWYTSNNPSPTWNPWVTTTPSYWGTTTPSSYNMCPYGAVSSMSKQQCFQIFFGNLTFIEAEMDCQSRNGHLASVHNAFDNMILNDYARNMIGASSQFYIGANDLTNKQWAWTDSTQFDYADWYTYQSGNPYSDCALVDTSNGAWIRSDCYTRAYYACSVPSYPY